MDQKISLPMKKYNKFIERSFEDRKKESTTVIAKYPDRVPTIICVNDNLNASDFSKIKYLIPLDLTVGQFLYVIRRRCKLNPCEAMILSIKDNILPTSVVINDIKNQYIDEDGFLYFNVAGENTFG